MVRAGLVIAAAAAALALWAGLSAAGADTTPTGGDSRVVFTQTESGGGHHCHHGDGSTGDQDTTPQPANQSSSV